MRAISKLVGTVVVASLCTAAATTTTSAAHAETEVSPTGKGIAGGALLGGELGFLTLSAFGARSSWMYYTIPTALAIGGGVGGYFIEKGGSPNAPMYMLAGGMALLIPTVVVTLSANSYSAASEDGTPNDAAPTGGSVKAEAGGGGGGAGGTTAPTTGPAKHKVDGKKSLPLALLNLGGDESLRFGVPLVHLRPTFTTDEMATYGVKQRYEVHAPVVALKF